MNTLVFLQARISSSRLPGKVLKPILGRPMLAHQFDRLRQSKHISGIVVVTSQQSEDDGIESLAKKEGVQCFRGSLENVLERFVRAADVFSPDLIVRVTGDCPLIDAKVLDEVVLKAKQGKAEYDYVSNILPGRRTFPHGLDVEVFYSDVLRRVYRRAVTKETQEHVTYQIYAETPWLYSLSDIQFYQDWSSYRWTVDTAEDFSFISTLYERLNLMEYPLGFEEIVAEMKRLEIPQRIVPIPPFKFPVNRAHA